MRIGIIGAGRIGQAAATRLLAAGHEVAIANSRGPETLGETVAGLGAGAHAVTPTEAASFGDVVLVAIPVRAIDELPAAEFAGRIVIDANNYYPDRDGRIAELDAGTTTSSELLAMALPGARIVKALNTIYYERLRQENRPAGDPARLAIPLAGDDAEAKRIVAGLIDDMGFDPVDAGALADGARQQPGTAVYNNPVGVDAVRAALARV